MRVDQFQVSLWKWVLGGISFSYGSIKNYMGIYLLWYICGFPIILVISLVFLVQRQQIEQHIVQKGQGGEACHKWVGGEATVASGAQPTRIVMTFATRTISEPMIQCIWCVCMGGQMYKSVGSGKLVLSWSIYLLWPHTPCFMYSKPP